MHLLDSRPSRMSLNQALCTLHVDYIGDDYYTTALPIARTASIPTQKGFYLRVAIKPLYCFIRGQGYEVVGGSKFVR